MKYTADFLAQAWINDYAYAVDPQGDTSWDCTAFVEASFSSEQIAKALEGTDHFTLDEIKNDPAAPEWVRKWSGPYEVELYKEE